MDTESELRPKQPLMLKEWLELESSAELSRDGFGCYPRHLAAEFWNAGGRRRNGDVIARVSTAVRAALLRTTSVIDGEAGALTRSFSKRLRVGLWKKQRGEREEMDWRRVPSCSATVVSGRRDDSSSPAMSPRRVSWEGRRTSTVDGGVALGSRRSQEAEAGKNVAGSKCETARRLDVDREQEQRLSPVSVMDFPGPNEEDGNNEIDGSNGHGEDDVAMSPTFARSMKNTRRASQRLLQKIRQFEQLAELDPSSDVDVATTATEDASYCHVAEWDIEDVAVEDMLGVLQARSPMAACRFQKLLEDFFREGLAPSCHGKRSDDPDTTKLLLETANSWLDGRHCTLRSDWKGEVEEMERVGWWRRFREDEQEMLAVDVGDDIFWSLMDELVEDFC